MMMTMMMIAAMLHGRRPAAHGAQQQNASSVTFTAAVEG